MVLLISLVVNEIALVGVDSGWVEVYNEGRNTVDLSNYVLETDKGRVNLSGVLVGGEYRIFHVKLGEVGGEVRLLENGNEVDSHSWNTLPKRGSLGRIPDGEGPFRILPIPTPGRPNGIAASLDEDSWGKIKALFGPKRGKRPRR